MWKPGKFLRLPSAERRLFVRAVLLLAAVRLRLAVRSFQSVRQYLDRRRARRPAMGKSPLSAERVAWLVGAASRNVMGTGTCLPRALVTQYLLRRQGHAAELRIGVRRNARGVFEAHAWAELDGEPIQGSASGSSRFSPLGSMEGESL